MTMPMRTGTKDVWYVRPGSGNDVVDMELKILPPLHVKVEFGDGISNAAQRTGLLTFEKHLRNATGLDVQVFKDAKGDDSRLRSLMTAEQRAKL